MFWFFFTILGVFNSCLQEYKCGRGDGIYPIYGTTWSSYSFGDNYTTNPLTWPNCVEEEYFEVNKNKHNLSGVVSSQFSKGGSQTLQIYESSLKNGQYVHTTYCRKQNPLTCQQNSEKSS